MLVETAPESIDASNPFGAPVKSVVAVVVDSNPFGLSETKSEVDTESAKSAKLADKKAKLAAMMMGTVSPIKKDGDVPAMVKKSKEDEKRERIERMEAAQQARIDAEEQAAERSTTPPPLPIAILELPKSPNRTTSNSELAAKQKAFLEAAALRDAEDKLREDAADAKMAAMQARIDAATAKRKSFASAVVVKLVEIVQEEVVLAPPSGCVSNFLGIDESTNSTRCYCIRSTRSPCQLWNWP